MDANLAKVNEILKEYGSFRMIHGHTHRPQVHDFQLDGHLVQRFVLPEWNGEESILCWDEKGFQWEGVTWSPAYSVKPASNLASWLNAPRTSPN